MERLADRMGRWLASEFAWTSDQQEVASFSLLLVISTTFTLALLAGLGWIAGVLAETLIMAGTSAVLRIFGGGAHLSSGWRCSWVTALTAVAAASVARVAGPAVERTLGPYVPWALIALGLVVAAVMARRAPVTGPEKPIRSERQRRTLRFLAVAVGLLWPAAWIVLRTRPEIEPSLWMASALGLLQETLSVTPSGGRAARWIDRKLARSE